LITEKSIKHLLAQWATLALLLTTTVTQRPYPIAELEADIGLAEQSRNTTGRSLSGGAK
jgi:hypothetical protein